MPNPPPERKFRVRPLVSYLLKAAAALALVGALVSLVLLFTQFTGRNISTNTTYPVLVDGSSTYLIASSVCNVLAIILVFAYYILVGRQYRPYQHQIKAGRMWHFFVPIGAVLLAVAVGFFLMAWTYKTSSADRNAVAIGVTVVLAVLNLFAVGYEQWIVYQVERDILLARTGGELPPKKDDPAPTPRTSGDDPRASATPSLPKKDES